MSPMRAILLVLCCSLSALCSRAQEGNPGVVVRLSQSALDYAAQRAIRILSDHIRNGASIPDASGSSGKTTYSLTNLHVKDFRPPGSTVKVETGSGVKWTLRNADITVGGKWRYRHKRRLFSLSDSGTLTMSLSDVSIETRVSLGSTTNGSPTISMLGCSASVGRTRARFSGSLVSWLYNLLYRFVERKIRTEISEALCRAVQRTVETDGARELANLQTEIQIQNSFILDYGLTRSPLYSENYIESFHRGQFRWMGDPHGPQLHPSPMQRHSSAMVAIYVSDYVINTLAYVMHKHGQLSYTFTKNDLPAVSRNLLDMTCTLLCLGTVFRNIAALHPESSAELITSVARPPTVKISHGTVQIKLEGEMKVVVRGNGGRHVDLVIVVFSGLVHGSAWIENNKIVGRVINASVAIVNTTVLLLDYRRSIVDGMLGYLNSILEVYSQARIIPQLNRVASIGFQLPKLKDINFNHPRLTLRDGFILVETDAAYKE